MRAWSTLRIDVVKTTCTCTSVWTATGDTIIRRGRWLRDLRRIITFFDRCRRGVGHGRHETSNAASALFYESFLLLFYGNHRSNLFDCIGVITLDCKTHDYGRDGCGSGLFWVGSDIDAKGLRTATDGYAPLF